MLLVVMLSGSIVGPALAQNPHGHMGSGPPESEFAAQMMQAMERMDAGMMAAKPTGNPDRDFAAMMIPHHQGAIDMAKVETDLWPRPRFAASCARNHCHAAAGDRADAALRARRSPAATMNAALADGIRHRTRIEPLVGATPEPPSHRE
jgi:hypothetical protein